MEDSSSPANRYKVMKSLLIYYFVQVLNLLLLSDCSYCSYYLALTVRERGEFKVGSYCLTVLLFLLSFCSYYLAILTVLLLMSCYSYYSYCFCLQIGETIVVFALIVLIV
jgi:hypothetical protein